MPAAPVTLWVRQSLSSDADGVENTFSSWDNCMDKSYCKWPVIAAIIIGSLIALSIIFCIARCLCCGVECCCGCLSCCNACCPSPRGGRRDAKYQDLPSQGYQPSPYQGYQPTPAPPVYIYNQQPPQPQYAQFEASRPGARGGYEDSLPAMPSWDTASTKRVLDQSHDEMELGVINPADEQKAPMLGHQSPAPGMEHEGAFESAAVGAAAYGQQPYRDQHPPQNLYGRGSPALGVRTQSPPQAYGSHAPYDSAPSAQRSYGGSPAPPYQQQTSYTGQSYQNSQNLPGALTSGGSHGNYGAPSTTASTMYEPSSASAYHTPSQPAYQAYPGANSDIHPSQRQRQDTWRDV